METVSFEQVVSRGCGLDVHKETVVATIDGEGLERTTREFRTFTRSLTELKDWLLEKALYMRVRVYIGSLFFMYRNPMVQRHALPMSVR